MRISKYKHGLVCLLLLTAVFLVYVVLFTNDYTTSPQARIQRLAHRLGSAWRRHQDICRPGFNRTEQQVRECFARLHKQLSKIHYRNQTAEEKLAFRKKWLEMALDYNKNAAKLRTDNMIAKREKRWRMGQAERDRLLNKSRGLLLQGAGQPNRTGGTLQGESIIKTAPNQTLSSSKNLFQQNILPLPGQTPHSLLQNRSIRLPRLLGDTNAQRFKTTNTEGYKLSKEEENGVRGGFESQENTVHLQEDHTFTSQSKDYTHDGELSSIQLQDLILNRIKENRYSHLQLKANPANTAQASTTCGNRNDTVSTTVNTLHQSGNHYDKGSTTVNTLHQTGNRNDTVSTTANILDRSLEGQNETRFIDKTDRQDEFLTGRVVDNKTATEMSSFSLIEKRFAYRRQLLKNACDEFGDSGLFRKMLRRQMVLPAHVPASNVSVRYCPIEKTGSTTWVNMLHAIDKYWRQTDIPSSGIVPSLTFRQGRESRVWKKKREMQLRSNITVERSFVFIREPYSRLLSAYVDKLFSPNTMFWSSTGTRIVRNFRQHPTPHSLRCGHDVTFAEFVKHFIGGQETEKRRDGHFTPIHDHCDFCGSQYDLIGHLETLDEDLPYVLKAIQSPINYTEDFDSGTLNNNAQWVFSTMRQTVRACMTMQEAGQRLWKKWQIRGLVSKWEPFPFTQADIDSVNATAFFMAGQDASRRSALSNVERKSQKRDALGEAYASVSLQDRFKLKDIFFLDFHMFGFIPEPDFVFHSTTFNIQSNFSYFNLL